MPSTACGQGAAVVNGVRYYSLGGTRVLTNMFDISRSRCSALAACSSAGNRTMAWSASAPVHWGVVLRDNYGWNHLDEVNQIFGLRGLFSSNPVSVYPRTRQSVEERRALSARRTCCG